MRQIPIRVWAQTASCSTTKGGTSVRYRRALRGGRPLGPAAETRTHWMPLSDSKGRALKKGLGDRMSNLAGHVSQSPPPPPLCTSLGVRDIPTPLQLEIPTQCRYEPSRPSPLGPAITRIIDRTTKTGIPALAVARIRAKQHIPSSRPDPAIQITPHPSALHLGSRAVGSQRSLAFLALATPRSNIAFSSCSRIETWTRIAEPHQRYRLDRPLARRLV